MKILLTGSDGFIGKYVHQNLKEKGHEVIGFDLKKGDDITDEKAVKKAIQSTDGFIHLAGILGTPETVPKAKIVSEVNIIGSLNVYNAAKDKKGVTIGIGNHFMNNPYSITRDAVERFGLMYNKELGTNIAVVRGYNAYGPGQKIEPVRKIIPNFIVPALQDKELIVYGDGNQIMDMIYVEDMAEILVRALLEEHGVYDGVLEAGTGRRTRVNDIAEEVVKQVGKGKIKHVPMRPGEKEGATVLANPDTLKPLGDINFLALKDGIKKTIEYYRDKV